VAGALRSCDEVAQGLVTESRTLLILLKALRKMRCSLIMFPMSDLLKTIVETEFKQCDNLKKTDLKQLEDLGKTDLKQCDDLILENPISSSVIKKSPRHAVLFPQVLKEPIL